VPLSGSIVRDPGQRIDLVQGSDGLPIRVLHAVAHGVTASRSDFVSRVSDTPFSL
jgi:hypothetical protein